MAIPKEINGTDNTIKWIIENNEPPERGPYSHSRMGNCPLQFYKDYVEKEEGTEITRFGAAVGTAMHDLGELDVIMRIEHPPEKWVKPIDLVERYVENHPEHDENMEVLIDQLESFRFNFEINPSNYVASEQRLGVDMGMNWVDYDDPNCWFRGRLDYLEVEESGLARLVDYKNYPSIHSNRKLNDIYNGVGSQLMGYLACLMAWDRRIQRAQIEVYYFRFGVSRSPGSFDDEGRWEVRVFTRDEVERWFRFLQRKMLVFERRENFPANPSQQSCQYCRHLHSCDWFQSKNKHEIIAGNPDEAEGLAKRMVVLQEERERLKDALGKWTNRHGAIEVGNGKKVGPVPKVRTKVDKSRFLDILEEHGIDPAPYVNVSKTRAEKVMKKHPKLRKELEKCITEKIGTRTNYG